MESSIALFGESEKGMFQKPYLLESLSELIDTIGQGPGESRGLDCAVQALLLDKSILFFRVREEGYSKNDYIQGLKELARKEKIGTIDAICLPGVGDREILDQTEPLCYLHKSIVITTEKDFYDYLTNN